MVVKGKKILQGILMDQVYQSSESTHLTRIKTFTLAFIEEILDMYFPAIDERLMDLADAASDQKQWDILLLARTVKEKQKQLDQIYESAICEGFLRFNMGQLNGKKKDYDLSTDLFLVSTDEMERDMAISSLTKRIETKYIENLYALNQRMAIVNQGKKIPEDGNPIGPYQFAEALHEMLEPLELNTHNQVLFCKAFEKLIVPRLGDLYEQVNKYLIEAGILPNLRYEINKNKTASGRPVANYSGEANTTTESAITNSMATSAQSQDSQAQAMHNQATHSQSTQSQAGEMQTFPVSNNGGINEVNVTVGDANYQRHMVNAIRQFQNQPSNIVSNYPDRNQQNTAHLVPVNSAQLITTLTVVQHADFNAATFEDASVAPLTVEHFHSVAHKLEKKIDQNECIADDHGRAIDLVGMIFEYMLSDDLLPDSIKSVLSYLHTPFLKIALLDQDFFEQANHPARQLLNLLANAGHRWVNLEGKSQFNAFAKIKSIVRRVMLEFNNELALFEELLAEMQEFNHKVEYKAELFEKRVQEKVQGEERLRVVKRRVYGEIKYRMADKELPAPVIVLLLHPCADYMTFVFLRYGESSQEWKDSLKVVDDVLWSIQAKTDKSECSRLVVLQHDLPERIRAMVKIISFSQTKSETLIKLLNELQDKAFSNHPIEFVDKNRRIELEHAALGELADDDPNEKSYTDQEKEIIAQFSKLEFGTWFEFDDFKGNKKQRLKLSWYNINTMRFMLVDSSGHKAEIGNAIVLVKLILNKEVRIVTGVTKPFIERALENILVRMKGAALH